MDESDPILSDDYEQVMALYYQEAEERDRVRREQESEMNLQVVR